MTTFIISKFPPPIQSSRWKQMIHSISRNMYTGSSFSTPISTFEEKIPLDNDRHDCTPISTVFASSQLDRLPVQVSHRDPVTVRHSFSHSLQLP